MLVSQETCSYCQLTMLAFVLSKHLFLQLHTVADDLWVLAIFAASHMEICHSTKVKITIPQLGP